LERYRSKVDSRRQYYYAPTTILHGLSNLTYWFLWKHPMSGRRWLEFGVFDQTPPKMGSAARPYGPRCWIFFPPQNYNSLVIGSALRASPFASFAAFALKHNPNVGSLPQFLSKAAEIFWALRHLGGPLSF